MIRTMEFLRFFSLLIMVVTVLQVESLPGKYISSGMGMKSLETAKIANDKYHSNADEKHIVKRQVVPGPTGPGQYGGTWNSKDGKTEVKAGIDFKEAPKLNWHADASHQIYKSPNGKTSVDAFGGARQPINQIGKSRPDVHGGIRVNF